MSELVKSIELVNLNLMKSDFEIINPKEAPNGGSVEFSCQVNFTEMDANDTNKFGMNTNFFVRGFREKEELFSFKLEFSAVFLKSVPDAFDEIENSLQMQFAMSFVYPYIRESIIFTLNKAGLGQIDVPFSFLPEEIVETLKE